MNLFYEQLRKKPNSFTELKISDPLMDLKTEYNDCQRCPLSNERTNVVFGSGFIPPKIMFVGLGASKYDSEVGVPFSDIPGRKIQGIIEYISRQLTLTNNIYYTNLLMCPGDATEETIQACSDRLRREMEIIKPKFIVLLGKEVAKYFCAEAERLSTHAIKIGGRYCPVFLTKNLKEILYKRDEVKAEVKDDLDYIVEKIKNEEQANKNGNKTLSR